MKELTRLRDVVSICEIVSKILGDAAELAELED
jgi:hypothetical protein